MKVHNKDELMLNFTVPIMSDSLFKSFSELIYSVSGINLQPRKKIMLINRLYRRLRHLKIATFDEYYNYLLTSRGRQEEIIKMIDAVSTNKTEFFREPYHFEYLTAKVLPGLISKERFKKNNTINIWSAGCSTGEEPYSIAIVLAESFGKYNLKPDFSVIGTDISTKVLEIAGSGIYKQDTVMPVPKNLLQKYFMQMESRAGDDYSIVPDLKKHVIIRRLNLMDDNFGHDTLMDIIFCRNVIIYFDRETQKKLFRKFHANLRQGGYIFIGNSESLQSISDDFRLAAPTIYKKL